MTFHLPLERDLAVQTWTSNRKPDCKVLVTWLIDVCGSREMPKNLDPKGRFPFSQKSGISGSAVNGTRFVGSSHWKIPRKSGNLKRWSRFPGWNFRTECRVPFTFLVVCTSSRSTVGHRDVPGFTTKWNNFLPIGNSIFAPTEISGFFS